MLFRQALMGSLVLPCTEKLYHGAQMERFRQRPIVVLSPHFDDACFSLGCFLTAVGHGVLVNIFTDGLHLANRKAVDKAEPDPKVVFDIRNAEDAAFDEHCGLVRHNLRCKEPWLLGRRWNDLRYVEDDVAQISSPVMAMLTAIAGSFASADRGILFCPLAIGPHCNHRATAEVVRRHLPEIAERYDVLFYEDQPYAAKLIDRHCALHRVNSFAGTTLSVRHVFISEWPEKKALTEFYPSQFRRTPRRRMFWPAAFSPFAPHEAFWSLRKPAA